MDTMQRFWQYLTECLRLLYWAFFKPFTFNHWLQQEVHPHLTFKNNPFHYRQEFAENPKLQRYAGQVVWINLLIPWLMMPLVAIPYTLISVEVFVWSKSVLFLCGWNLGVLLATIVPDKFKINVIEHFAERGDVNTIFTLMFALGFDVMMAFDGVVSVAFGIMCGVMCGVGSGVLGSVIVGVVVGVAGDMMIIIFLVLGILFRIYLFWPFEALWMLGSRLLYPPHQADRALRWLPFHFDENMNLPLPFMTQLVTEAHRVNSLAALHTLDHLVNFTNQQTTPGHITRQIALDTMQSCQTEYEIAHLTTDKLDWIPEPPPKSLGTLLPKCLDLSRNVRSAYEAISAYRHKELLAKPLKDLTQLRQQLAFENNSLIRTSLGQITQRWLTILETAQRTLTEQIQHSGELPAMAYIAGNALDAEVATQNFRGRQDLFAEIENLKLAVQPPILLLYGGRRTGKTSALKYLPQRTGTELVPLLVDLQGVAEASTLVGVAEGMAKQMTDFARTSRNMTLPPYDRDAFRLDPFFALRDWFKDIETTIPHKRFLLCLDEFERLEEVVTTTISRAPLNFLRTTIQYHPRWILLFSGSHHPHELADYWSDYLINTRTLRLSYLQETEARDLIEHPSADFPPPIYDPLAIDAIIHHTRCQPYLVQLLCQNVIECLNRDQRRLAQLPDVTAAIPQALERGQQYFNEMWQHTLKNATHRIIIQKVLSEQALTEEETQHLPFLIDKEILETTDTGYRCQVPLVERFLRGKTNLGV